MDYGFPPVAGASGGGGPILMVTPRPFLISFDAAK